MPHLKPLTRCCGLPSTKAAVEHFALVGAAVAVGVFGIDDVGRAGDQHAAAPGRDAVGIAEVVENSVDLS